MAKITIAGDAVVITSECKLEELKLVEKYRPNALVLKGGEDGKEPIFAVGTGRCGTINAFGATFASEAHDGSGLATITMCADNISGDPKEWVAEQVGTAILNLNKVEETLPAAIEEIAAEKAAILANITVA